MFLIGDPIRCHRLPQAVTGWHRAAQGGTGWHRLLNILVPERFKSIEKQWKSIEMNQNL
jgi:hypothetical protein